MQVVNLLTGKVVLDQNVDLTPVADVYFESSDEIHLILFDDHIYRFIYGGKKFCTTQNLPTKTQNPAQADMIYVSYQNSDEKYEVLQSLSESSVDLTVMPSHWFINERVYKGRKNRLHYKHGTFCLNGDPDKVFSSVLYDFNLSHRIEEMADASVYNNFIREKNDIMSSVYEFGDRYMVLLSRMLNSLVVFDLSEMKIISAHKFKGNIIGDRLADENTVEVIVDRMPYFRKIKLDVHI